MDAISLARFLMLQGADLLHSRFVSVDGELAGFGYINRTADILRLGGMALVPSARGTGAAAYLLEHLCDEGHANGAAAMVLEVIEQNPRAHAVYRRHGFRELGRLRGWRLRADAARPAPRSEPLEDIPVIEALRAPASREYPDLPWAISSHAVAKVAKTRAFRSGPACVVISDPETQPIRVHSLSSPSSDAHELRTALHAVLDGFPAREFFAPPVWPEEFGPDVYEPLAFTAEPLSQFLMRREL
jgi:hypothetical protein